MPLVKHRQSTKDLLKESIDRFSGSAALLAKNYHLEPVFADVSHNDTFLSLKSVCQLVEQDVVAVIGMDLDNLDYTLAAAAGICTLLEINIDIKY